MKYVFFIAIALSTVFFSCKGGSSKPTAQVSGDTTFVSEPTLVVSKAGWEAYVASGAADDAYNLERTIKEFNAAFPGKESLILDVSTKTVFVKASNVTFSFDTPPYMYMVTVEGKVAPIVNVSESKDMLSQYLVNRETK
jgi:hypothetical protein